MFYARILNGLVHETVELPDNVALSDVYIPAVADEFVTASENVSAGWRYQDGEFFPPYLSIDLAALKANLKTSIDRTAESERLNYITGGAGQAMTYQQKSDEAKRYLATSDPDDAEYPLLSAEVGITAPDLAGVAQVVNAAFTQWQIIGAAIERTRLATKAAIEAATTVEEAQAAFEGANWPIAPN